MLVFVGFKEWRLELIEEFVGSYLLKNRSVGKVSFSSAISGASAYRQLFLSLTPFKKLHFMIKEGQCFKSIGF